mmetsp:Transcript_22815/g.81436  ORF Transcript_22815/g.81436 Transcript_22815/m.81436 type:complete len:267 (-) Transcript_22815:307-1107(-)
MNLSKSEFGLVSRMAQPRVANGALGAHLAPTESLYASSLGRVPQVGRPSFASWAPSEASWTFGASCGSATLAAPLSAFGRTRDVFRARRLARALRPDEAGRISRSGHFREHPCGPQNGPQAMPKADRPSPRCDPNATRMPGDGHGATTAALCLLERLEEAAFGDALKDTTHQEPTRPQDAQVRQVGCFARALQLQDDGADIWYNVGHVGVAVGDAALAHQAFTIAVSLDADHAEALNNLGVLELRKRNLDQASAHFGAAQAKVQPL